MVLPMIAAWVGTIAVTPSAQASPLGSPADSQDASGSTFSSQHHHANSRRGNMGF